MKTLKDLKALDIDKVAKAIEAEAGQAVAVQQHGPVRMGDCHCGSGSSRRSEGGSGNRGKAVARYQWEKEWDGKSQKRKLIY
jgi:hypothetical protein